MNDAWIPDIRGEKARVLKQRDGKEDAVRRVQRNVTQALNSGGVRLASPGKWPTARRWQGEGALVTVTEGKVARSQLQET